MYSPPRTGDEELDAFLNQVYILINDTGTTPNGNPTTSEPTAYTDQYLHVKYADDNVGTGLTDSPTNKTYWGVYNHYAAAESTNPADYQWFSVSGGFGTTSFLWFILIGVRTVKFKVDTVPPVADKWIVAPTAAIDLDILQQENTITSADIVDGAVTADKLGIIDYVNFNISPSTTEVHGQLKWNQANDTLSILQNGLVTSQVTVFNGTPLDGDVLRYDLATLSWVPHPYQKTVTKAIDYTILLTDHTILVSAAAIITLPLASTCSGQVFYIKRTGTGTVTLTAAGSDTIDGSATAAILVQYVTLAVQSDGTTWSII